MATATAHHYVNVNPYNAALTPGDPADPSEEFANRKLICAVAPDAPVGGFAG